MDQPHSHITPGLPPRSNKKPGAFSHHSLSPRVAALLTGRQRELRDQGKNTTADVLAQLAARAAAVLEHECERNNRCTGGYLRPTMAALFWRDLSLRRLLRGCPQPKQLPVSCYRQ